ncbi:MAG: CDP-alcohol phosphatidyltransferase family protein [Dokdonella sp.]|nr:CDP-alcohol phosphatidyltransferase family protein [Dokdonella sp.]
MLRHLPNLITLLRLALVWPVYWQISKGQYEAALILAAIAGGSDAVDGWLAKHFGWESRLGGLMDPLADKLLLLAAFTGLTMVDVLPAWMLGLIVGRDLLIVSGAVAYHNLIGAFDARPTWLSKTTTLFQILLVLAELLRLSWVPQLSGLDALLVFTAVLTVASGVHYVLVWSMRARRAWAARRHLQQGE